MDGAARKVLVPPLGTLCGLESKSIVPESLNVKLPLDKQAIETAVLFLSLIDCQEQEGGELQVCLRNESYPVQMYSEVKVVEALQHTPSPYGDHPLTGGEYRVDECVSNRTSNPEVMALWDEVEVRVAHLKTAVATVAWSCFLRKEALLQLSFDFGPQGEVSDLVKTDVDAMVEIIKQMAKMLAIGQMLAVSVYIDGATCEPHRSILLVSADSVVYYDPPGSASSHSRHHAMRSRYIIDFLCENFGADSDVEFTAMAGVDHVCPQGAPGSCDFNCNALCMLAVTAASYVGVSKAMLVMSILRRLGVKVMDRMAANLPTVLVKFALAHATHALEIPPSSLRLVQLGGWQPSAFDHYEALSRLEASIPEWRLVVRAAIEGQDAAAAGVAGLDSSTRPAARVPDAPVEIGGGEAGYRSPCTSPRASLCSTAARSLWGRIWARVTMWWMCEGATDTKVPSTVSERSLRGRRTLLSTYGLTSTGCLPSTARR
jgi:hypothetical protein